VFNSVRRRLFFFFEVRLTLNFHFFLFFFMFPVHRDLIRYIAEFRKLIMYKSLGFYNVPIL